MTSGDVFSSFKCSENLPLLRHCPVSFYVRHDFCNSPEHRELDTRNRRSPDQLDSRRARGESEMQEEQWKLETVQKQKHDKDTGYKIEKDSQTFR